MAQNNQQKNAEEGEPQFVQHNLQNWYRQGIQKGENIQKRMEHNRAPYGEEWGLDPELWDEMGKWGCDERVLLPIQGPVHWSHVWLTGHSAGKDHEQRPPFNEPLIPTQLNYMATHPSHIDWVKELGGGSFGVVWEVLINQTTRISTGPMGQGHWGTQRVRKACKAMRLMNQPFLYLEERVQQMLNDYTVIEGLNHPNVVKYDDYIPIPDSVTHFPFSTVLLIMDLCDLDLTKAVILCPGNRFSPESCSVFFKQIAPGLQYLHQNRVVHLDIKPDNIFLKFLSPHLTLIDFFWHPLVPNSFLFKLGDFGLSVKYDANQPMVTRTGGDINYIAPEICNSMVPVLAKPCDIYSLGMTLCATFAGGLMYNIRDHINQPPYTTKAPLLVQLIRDMLEDNPNDRPTIEQVLASDWLQM